MKIKIFSSSSFKKAKKFLIKQKWVFLVLILIIMAFFFGEGNLIERRINTQGNGKVQEGYDFSDFLFNDQEREPDGLNLKIDERENLVLLDNTLAKIFPQGYKDLSEEQKSIELLRFISVAYLNEGVNAALASEIIPLEKGFCGGRAIVFTALARRLGLPARKAEIYYLPLIITNHVVLETYYQDSWHMFDPSFGVFAYSKQNYDGQGKVLSLSEVRAMDGYFLQSIAENIATGNYSEKSKGFGVREVKPDFLNNFFEFSPTSILGQRGLNDFKAFYFYSLKNGFPVSYGSRNYASMPIEADLRYVKKIIFGKEDGLSAELCSFQTANKGSCYLGNNRGLTNVYHTWMVKVNKPTRVKVIYHWAQDYTPVSKKDINIIRLKSVLVKDIKAEGNSFEIELEIQDKLGLFILIPKEKVFVPDYIEVITI